MFEHAYVVIILYGIFKTFNIFLDVENEKLNETHLNTPALCR